MAVAECTSLLRGALTAALCVLVLVIVACLVLAVLGPRFTDRVVCANVIGTVVNLMVCLLSYLLGEDYLVDVAILYALLNLLSMAVLSRVAAAHHREKKEEEKP